MKINISQVFLDQNDTELRYGEGRYCLANVMIDCLLSVSEDEKNMPADEKYRRYKLFKKIDTCESDDCDLSVAEVSLMKDLIGKKFAPIIVGQAFDWLDPKPEVGSD